MSRHKLDTDEHKPDIDEPYKRLNNIPNVPRYTERWIRFVTFDCVLNVAVPTSH